MPVNKKNKMIGWGNVGGVPIKKSLEEVEPRRSGEKRGEVNLYL